MSIRRRIATLLVALISAGAILIGTVSYASAHRLILENKKADMSNTINLIDIHVTSAIRNIEELTDYTAKEPAIEKAVDSGNALPDTNVAALNSWFDHFYNTYESVSNFYLLNEENEITFQYQEDSKIYSLTNLEGTLKKAKEHSVRSFWTGVQYSQKASRISSPMIYLVHAVNGTLGEDGTKAEGMLVLEFDPDSFANLLINNMSAFSHQHTMILDGDGNVVCSTNASEPEYLDRIAEKLNGGERYFELKWNQETNYIYGRYNGLTGWQIVTIVPTKDVFPQLAQLRNYILLIVVGMVLVCWLIGLWFAYTLTKPINKLRDAMEQTEKGNFEIRIQERRMDEIGSLIHSFNYMSSVIKNLIQKISEEKVAQKNAELGALQAQINPHFLYNTLDTVNWMLLTRGENDISDIIIDLGDLMKYSIHGDIELVEIEQEKEYIASYLRIQKCRMEQRLNYEIEIPEELCRYKIPKLTLQPIVENAISHGIEPKETGGNLWIRIYEQFEQIIISVKDDGVGIASEELPEESRYGSIGLSNVQRRIQLHYGSGYGIVLKKCIPCGTEVMIRIPKEQ
ncbi:MAG: sensor histidine kinase [Hespellia sp.]|nr:sensor histidine kinase [Hespellia sp.]